MTCQSLRCGRPRGERCRRVSRCQALAVGLILVTRKSLPLGWRCSADQQRKGPFPCTAPVSPARPGPWIGPAFAVEVARTREGTTVKRRCERHEGHLEGEGRSRGASHRVIVPGREKLQGSL